jgi:3'-5' exoribonuclease
MSEYRLPIPTAAPDNVVAKLPPVFRVQSISRLPLDNHCVLNRAGLFHERASLMVEWPSRKVDVRLGCGLPGVDSLARSACEPRRCGAHQPPGRARAPRGQPRSLPDDPDGLGERAHARPSRQRAVAAPASALPTFVSTPSSGTADGCIATLVGASSLKGHHSCVHGNLWHTLEVAEQALRMAQGQPLACPEVLLMAAPAARRGQGGRVPSRLQRSRADDRGKLVGHRNTIIEWIAAAIAHARIALPESHYLGLIHALTSARGAPDWLGLREPCTLDAVLLSAADRLSGQIELMARHSPAEAGVRAVSSASARAPLRGWGGFLKGESGKDSAARTYMKQASQRGLSAMWGRGEDRVVGQNGR